METVQLIIAEKKSVLVCMGFVSFTFDCAYYGKLALLMLQNIAKPK